MIGVCGVMGDRLRWISDMLGLGLIKYERLGGSPSPLSSVIYGQMVERNSKLGTLSFLCLDSERFKDHWRSLETKLQIQQEEGGICGKLGKSPALFQCVTQRTTETCLVYLRWSESYYYCYYFKDSFNLPLS